MEPKKIPMIIAILSRNSALYSTRRMIEAAKQRGHDVRGIDPLRCYMTIASQRPTIHYKGEELVGYDAIIPRIGASVTFYGTAVVRQFEMVGVTVLMSLWPSVVPVTSSAACSCWRAKGSACR